MPTVPVGGLPDATVGETPPFQGNGPGCGNGGVQRPLRCSSSIVVPPLGLRRERACCQATDWVSAAGEDGMSAEMLRRGVAIGEPPR